MEKLLKCLKMTALPAYVDPQTWAWFVENRSAMKRVPFTQGAKLLVIRKLIQYHDAGYDSNALLEKAVECGWRTVYPDEKMRIKHAQASVDPALAKIEADRKAATPMPASVREKLGLLRSGA